MNVSRPEPPTPDGSDASSPLARWVLSRRAFAGGMAAAAGLSLLGSSASSTVSAANARTGANTAERGPHGFGSVSTAPRVPRGFVKAFDSRFIRANGIRQHVVTGGDGPPLLPVHGWPENWYARR